MVDRPILQLLTSAIAVPEKRIGFFDAEHAANLGALIAADGQHDPIHVKRNGNAAKLPWTLIAGLHRLRGAEKAGLSEIDAIQVADASASADELRQLELSENLDHRQRRPIERAIFMAERARLEEAVDHPGQVGEASQIRAGRARQSASDTVSLADCWRTRTARAMSCSVKTLERYRLLNRNIVEALPDLAERLNFHPLGEKLSAMTKIATLNTDFGRRRIVELLLSRDDWKSISEVMVAAGAEHSHGFRQKDPTRRIMEAWSLMSLRQRKTHVEWLADEMTPGMASDLVARLRENGRLP